MSQTWWTIQSWLASYSPIETVNKLEIWQLIAILLDSGSSNASCSHVDCLYQGVKISTCKLNAVSDSSVNQHSILGEAKVEILLLYGNQREGHRSAKCARAYRYTVHRKQYQVTFLVEGGIPHKKGRSAKEPLRGTSILFCGCGFKCFSPLQGINSYHILFQLNTSKTYCKSSCCRAFEAEHAKRYQTAFLSPKRYEKYPSSLHMGDPHSHLVYLRLILLNILSLPFNKSIFFFS